MQPAALALLCASPLALAQGSTAASWPGSEGILHAITNAHVSLSNGNLLLTRDNPAQPIRLLFGAVQSVGVERDQDSWWVLPLNAPGQHIETNTGLWILPSDPASHDASWHVDTTAHLTAEQTADGQTVLLTTDQLTLRRAEPRPHSDLFGRRFSIDVGNGHLLEDTLAAFYWGTMLPSVVERTLAAHFPYSSGYVLSTLNTSRYAGSYPAVDHEFQIAGRLAFASPFDLDLVKRMLDLQLRLMDDDPEHLSRAPTSVQPDGRREYHIRRDSEDHRENAAMFPVTANIEVIEEAWTWYQTTGDRAWLTAHIAGLERSATWVLSNTDQYHRLWSDVFYEDQVIKDGRVTQAQAFAAHAFDLLSEIESLLGRPTQAALYRGSSRSMARALIAPLPDGFWSPQTHRFVDWVDRNGIPHEHVHLLANTLPVTLGFATPDQRRAVEQLIAANDPEFERFPSFLSAHIDAYTPSEIGIAGPYDLSAAGRYWFWDAAYRASQNQNSLLLHQLTAVAQEAAESKGYMGERYDMDHVFYVDGQHAHGADRYYEYPNVFTAVLLSDLLGLAPSASSGLHITPHLPAFASVTLEQPAYAIEYRWDSSGFTLTNLAPTPRHFVVDLSALPTGSHPLHLAGSHAPSPVTSLTLAPRQQAHWLADTPSASPTPRPSALP